MSASLSPAKRNNRNGEEYFQNRSMFSKGNLNFGLENKNQFQAEKHQTAKQLSVRVCVVVHKRVANSPQLVCQVPQYIGRGH